MIFIALGANLDSPVGQPADTFSAALEILRSKNVETQKKSSLWQTPPWPPGSMQPDYINAVIQADTDLPPQELLALLLEVEAGFGRNRTEKNAARPLDLDLIAYNDLITTCENLSLPHERMIERLFVLLPLKEIAPEWRHPVNGLTPEQMIVSLRRGDEKRLAQIW